MTSTERKLDEAKYFLGQLNIDDPYFDYILSAYLNAARSTTWIMRHEFNKINGWEDWFKSREISKDQKQLLNKINELRIESTKQSGVKTDFYFLEEILIDEQYYSMIKEFLKKEGEVMITVTPIDEIKDDAAIDGIYDEKIVFMGQIDRTKDRSLNSRKEIYKSCIAYFEFLQIQVTDCIAKFKLQWEML